MIREFLIKAGLVNVNLHDVHRSVIMSHLKDKGVRNDVFKMLSDLSGGQGIYMVESNKIFCNRYKVIINRWGNGTLVLGRSEPLHPFREGCNCGEIDCDFLKEHFDDIGTGINDILLNVIPEKWKEWQGRKVENVNQRNKSQQCLNKMWKGGE
jgi:hypothetical protein